MKGPDLSHQDLGLATAIAALAGVVIGGWISLTFVQGAVVGAAWTGIVGAAVGGIIAFVATTYHDRKRREREIDELKASLYAEIADRAARSVNDYLEPWRGFQVSATNNLNSERVGKFRPTDPVVFPGIAGKLGLFGPEVVLAVTQFYFRLDALAGAIDSLTAFCEKREMPGALPVVGSGDRERANLIAIRLRSCFPPALRALEKLAVPRAELFDAEVVHVYPHLRDSGLSLRDALAKLGPPIRP